MIPVAVFVGGPVHGQTMQLSPLHSEGATVVFIQPAEWATDPSVQAPGHLYKPVRVPLLGRAVTIYHHEGTPLGSRHVPHVVLSEDGLASYSEGWGKDRAEPTGPAGVLLLSPATAARWVEIEDPVAPVAWRGEDGAPAGHIRKLVLCDRWIRVAIEASATIPRHRFRPNWFDTACARALLTPEARDLWEAAA